MSWGGLDKALDKFQAILTNKKQDLLESCGEALVTGTVQRFMDEEDPEGNKWEPSGRAWQKGLGHATRKATKNRKGRRFKADSGNFGKTLTDTARLRNSIDYAVAGDTVLVGSNAAYALIHQKGGMAGRGHKTRIPARPYLGISKNDWEEIEGAIQDFIVGAFK